LKDLNKIELILWEKLKRGDIHALGEIYDLYIDILFSYGIQMSKDKSYVMDCIHDLFLDIYKYRAKLASTDNVKYYLIKSLKRKINKKYNSKIVSIDNEDCFHTNSYTTTKSFEEEIIASEESTMLNLKLADALISLSKRQRKGLFLRFNEEMPYEEIAQIMNVSIQTSRTIIYRGVKQLRKCMILFLIYMVTLFFY
jgi:RNA polymerase sigma-70 factor (ECF subfamily)